MLYLLDANVIITAHNTYYPIDRVPEFWEWLQHRGQSDQVKIPIEEFPMCARLWALHAVVHSS